MFFVLMMKTFALVLVANPEYDAVCEESQVIKMDILPKSLSSSQPEGGFADNQREMG